MVALALAHPLASFACTKKPVTENLADRAKVFRERQRKEAIKAYSALVEKYPESPYTEKARERLQQLGPTATPKK
jgi:outer membrane protein assembly factor BamD (BamD/ComL family)